MPEKDLQKQKRQAVSAMRMDPKSFDSEKYLDLYYPEIKDIEGSATLAKSMQQIFEEGKPVNIREISEQTQIPDTVIENIAIVDFQRLAAQSLFKEFPRGDALILDMGGGPTIHQHIPVSLASWHITHTDFLEKNRAIASHSLQNLKNNRWDSYLALSKKLLQEDAIFGSILENATQSKDSVTAERAKEVQGILAEEGIAALRNHIQNTINEDVVHGDLFREDLGLPEPSIERYDAITSYFALESATGDHAQWEAGLANISSKLSPGGLLIMAALLNATWYQVGDERVPAVNLTEEDIRTELKRNNFGIETLRVSEGSNKAQVGFDGLLFVIAKKEHSPESL